MTIGSLVLAFIAGVLSILSPCVLPIIPVVLGAAASHHKLGPVALASGLSISFVSIGLFVATIGHLVGLNEDVFRYVAASLIIAIGVVLLLPALQTRLAVASGPIANWTDQRFGNTRGSDLFGQFWIGVLLGAVWSPCVRNQLLSTGHGVKVALGLLFVAIGALVLSGFDKTVETALVDASPQWLTDLSTRF